MQYRWPEAKTEMVLHPGFINNYGRKAFWNGEQCFYTRFNRTQVLRPRTVTGHATTKSHQGNSTQTQACPVLVVVTMDNQVPEVVVDRYSYHKVFTERCLVVAKRMQLADLCSTYLSSCHFIWPCSYFRDFLWLACIADFLNDMLVKELLVYCFNNWRE